MRLAYQIRSILSKDLGYAFFCPAFCMVSLLHCIPQKYCGVAFCIIMCLCIFFDCKITRPEATLVSRFSPWVRAISRGQKPRSSPILISRIPSLAQQTFFVCLFGFWVKILANCIQCFFTCLQNTSIHLSITQSVQLLYLGFYCIFALLPIWKILQLGVRIRDLFVFFSSRLRPTPITLNFLRLIILRRAPWRARSSTIAPDAITIRNTHKKSQEATPLIATIKHFAASSWEWDRGLREAKTFAGCCAIGDLDQLLLQIDSQRSKKTWAIRTVFPMIFSGFTNDFKIFRM